MSCHPNSRRSNPGQGFSLSQNLLKPPSPLAHRDPSVLCPVSALIVPKELGLQSCL